PGAHGRLTIGGSRLATRTERVPERWLRAVEEQGTGELAPEPIEPADQALECLMMGLRLEEGISLPRLARLARRPLPQLLDLEAMERLCAGGFLRHQGDRLRATPAGRLRLNAVLGRLVA